MFSIAILKVSSNTCLGCSAAIWWGSTPCKSAAIQDSFGLKGAFFLGIHLKTESLLSVKMYLHCYRILNVPPPNLTNLIERSTLGKINPR